MSLYLQEITDRVFLVSGEGGCRFPFSYSVLIRSDRSVLLDTGCGLDTLEEVRRRFRIHEVIHSHTHPDHMAGSRVFSGTPIWFPEESPEDIHDFDALARRFVGGGEVGKVWQEYVSRLMGFRPPERPWERYASGRVFDLGGLTLEAIHTPGHTWDHYCFWIPQERILFLADLDLSRFGPWYGHRESDCRQFRESIRRMRSLKASVLLSSHKAPVYSHTDRALEEYEGELDRQAEQVLQCLQEPRSVAELVRMSPFYRNSFPLRGLQHAFEEWLIRNMLRELIRCNRVVQVGSGEEERYLALREEGERKAGAGTRP